MSFSLHIARSLHFIGIGGAGMSGIAMVLSDRGFIITGSDVVDTQTLQMLRRKGVRIFRHQSASTIKGIVDGVHGTPSIVISTAVLDSNLELIAARQASLEVIHRSDVLSALVNKQTSIGVAGSHGKTTTSTLATILLSKTKHDPTSIIGGIIPTIEVNGQSGKGNLLIAEIDESDGSVIKFQPQLGIITNLELDHTNHYRDFHELIITLQNFANNCNRIIANRDCPILRDYFKAHAWWSNNNTQGVRFTGLPIVLQGSHSLIDFYEDGELVCRFEIPLPGLHNISNVTAAIAGCRLQGIKLDELTNYFRELEQPRRRFEFYGTWHGRLLVDDYAHHPSEIKATIAMARLTITSNSSPFPDPPLRLVVIFQPHRYRRTADFLRSFAIALSYADQILLAPLYSAGESPIDGISSALLGKVVEEIKPNLITLVAKDYTQLIQQINTFTQPNDLLITMGAGDLKQQIFHRLVNIEE